MPTNPTPARERLLADVRKMHHEESCDTSAMLHCGGANYCNCVKGKLDALLSAALAEAKREVATQCAQMADEATPTLGSEFWPAKLVRDRICREFGLGPVRSDVGTVLDRITGCRKFSKTDTDAWLREQLAEARAEQRREDAEILEGMAEACETEDGTSALCDSAAILRGGEEKSGD